MPRKPPPSVYKPSRPLSGPQEIEDELAEAGAGLARRMRFLGSFEAATAAKYLQPEVGDCWLERDAGGSVKLAIKASVAPPLTWRSAAGTLAPE